MSRMRGVPVSAARTLRISTKPTEIAATAVETANHNHISSPVPSSND